MYFSVLRRKTPFFVRMCLIKVCARGGGSRLEEKNRIKYIVEGGARKWREGKTRARGIHRPVKITRG